MDAFPQQVNPGARLSMSASDPGKPIAQIRLRLPLDLLQAVIETNMAAFPQQVNPGARLLMSASDPGKPIAQIRLRLQLESQREDQPALLPEIQQEDQPALQPEIQQEGQPTLPLEIQQEDQLTLPLEIQRPVSCPEVIEMNMVAFLRLDMFGVSHWRNVSAPGKHPARKLLPLHPQRHPQRPVHHCDLLPVPPCPEVIETNMVAFLRLDMCGA